MKLLRHILDLCIVLVIAPKYHRLQIPRFERVWTDKMNALSEIPGNEICLVTTDQGGHKVPYALDKKVRHI